ncbi:hypothetical protein B0H11DRAFT_2321221, partial [Mycena galericulata]
MDMLPDMQIVFAATGSSALDSSIWTQTLTIPLYAASISALVLVFRSLTRPRAISDPNVPQKSWKDITKYGGAIGFVHNLLRLLACLTLFGLSVASVVIFGARTKAVEKEWVVRFGLCDFYLYASLLAAAALAIGTRFGSAAKVHLDLLLVVAFGVYFYRDIFPFATYTWPIQDAPEGPILNAKLIALTLAAVVIPLVTPAIYIPVDPLNPMPVPNPEQVASPLSLMLLSFLDPVIALAYKLPHLPYDLLPPLADTDDSQNLKTRGF